MFGLTRHAYPKEKSEEYRELLVITPTAAYNDNVLYGVVQTGIHWFFIRQKNKADVLTGKAKFIHLYLLTDVKWLLKEVISFDHQSPD